MVTAAGRTRLGTLLIVVNVTLVLTAIGLVGAAALGLLRRLAEGQALARVDLAGAAALQAIEHTGVELLTSARLLAESRTLTTLLEEDVAGIAPYLERFRHTSGVGGCAVIRHGRILARAGPPFRWEEIVARAGTAERFILGDVGVPSLVSGARAVSPARPEAAVVVALPLDAVYARTIGGRVGLDVSIIERRAAHDPADPRGDLIVRALGADAPVADYVPGAGAYLSIAPLRDAGGAVAAVVETALPASAVRRPLRRLAWVLAGSAVVVAALATVVSVFVARRVAAPVESLTSAASRIGHGDLATPIPHAPGHEIGMLAETMDEMRARLLRVTAQLGRRRSEAEAVLSGIVEGVYSVDRDRRLRYMNPQAAALLGVRAEKAIGRFCGDVLDAREPDGGRPCEDRCPIVHARSRGSARATETLRLRDGTRRTVVVTSAPPARDGDGDEQQFQVIRDETETEAARGLRDAVVASISHEFKTPLSAQLAAIELLRDRLPEEGGAEAASLLLSLERGTLRLTHLIDNLLESLRVDAGRAVIRRRPVALDEVIEEATRLTAPLLEQRRQSLVVDLPYPLPPVTGDATRLTQVFVNLLANANKFAPDGSSISIGAEVAGRDIRLWVEDEGPGLPAGADQVLFRRFVRAPDGEPGESGMGLGLYIVRSIVERHGGSIVAGRGGREGARLTLVLPRAGES